VDEIILDVICALSGITASVVDRSTDRTTAHRSVMNPFLAYAHSKNNTASTTTTTISAIGLIGSIKLLVAPELLGTTVEGSLSPLVDSWMHSADQTLLAIVRQQGAFQFFGGKCA
jgi:hypothetical protein